VALDRCFTSALPLGGGGPSAGSLQGYVDIWESGSPRKILDFGNWIKILYHP